MPYWFIPQGHTEQSWRADIRKRCAELHKPPWLMLGPHDFRDYAWWWITQAWRRSGLT